MIKRVFLHISFMFLLPIFCFAHDESCGGDEHFHVIHQHWGSWDWDYNGKKLFHKHDGECKDVFHPKHNGMDHIRTQLHLASMAGHGTQPSKVFMVNTSEPL